jgi:MFS superfamily sulfate permease-like transporter
VKEYFSNVFAKDLVASIVVFLVALPLCMGIAIASGVPPAAGLVTGIIGGIVAGMLSGAPLQVSGPAAGLTVLVWQLVQDHGLEALGAAVVLAGAIQISAGLLRLGQWFRAISPAVIYGMLAGIGVLIFASQFHIMVDDAPRGSGIANLIAIPDAVYKGIFPIDGSTHHVAAAIGLLTIVAIAVWTKFAPRALHMIPAPLVAAAIATAISAIMQLPIKYVNVPESLIGAVRSPGADAFTALLSPDIAIAAVALAFIASAETLLCVTAVDQLHTGARANYDRELTAQGVGNMLCGFAGALPMTGVIVRSSANVEAGGRTRMSAVLHGVWLLAAVAAVPAVLRGIPTAALAAILVRVQAGQSREGPDACTRRTQRSRHLLCHRHRHRRGRPSDRRRNRIRPGIIQAPVHVLSSGHQHRFRRRPCRYPSQRRRYFPATATTCSRN